MPENGGGVTKAYGLCFVAEYDESQLAEGEGEEPKNKRLAPRPP